MVSLRARLIAALLGLATLGLLLLAAITYAEQRNFLMDRVDEQTRSAPPAVVNAMSYGGGGPRGAHGGRSDEPGGPGIGLPAGTYGEWRDSAGRLVRAVVLPSTDVAKPDLPSDPPIDTIFTVHGKGGDHTRYRVLAVRDRFRGDVVIAAVPLRDVDRTLDRLLLVEGLVIAGVLALLGAASWVVVRLGLRPLDRIGATAGRIAEGDLSHRVETTDPRTEVGRLGIALNAMLDRLERAFADREASEQRLRRFLADASHELRTPLSSIRGYAELFRMGAMRDDEELRRALRRVEEESMRMGVLVEDLLTLARLDEVAAAPHVPVDVAPLVRDAVDDARVTAPDREITFAVDGRAAVVGDADQLRQVLGNLMRNALVHTPAGTPIEVTADGSSDLVRLEIRDHGPGLPTEDAGALFERFWRAEGGRERGKGGAGLGLAIVAAVVDAHGGSVEAHNAPDGGAVFVVALPRAAAPVVPAASSA